MVHKGLSKLCKFSIAAFTAFSLLTIPTTTTKPKKEWKVSAYLDGDAEGGNTLDNAVFWNLNQMEKIGSNETMDIYAQIDRWDAGDYVYEPLNIDSTLRTRRYHVSKDDDMQKIKSKRIPGFDKELNMGLYRNFKDFIDWVENYDSKRHMVVIGGHGLGIMIPIEQIAYEGFEYESSDYALPTYVIDKVFDEELKNRLEVIIFDSCEKATIEVAYQLKDHSKIMIASENLMFFIHDFGDHGLNVSLSGVEYDKVLERIMQNPYIDVEELGKFIIDSYFETLKDNPAAAKKSITLSAIDLENIESFVEKFSKFSDVLIERMEDEETRYQTIKTLKLSLEETQDYLSPDALNLYAHIDLFDFLENIERHSNDGKLKRALNPLKKSDIIIKSKHQGEWVKNSNGISIMFIENFDNLEDSLLNDKKISEYIKDYYSQSDFAKKTGWDRVQELYQEHSKGIVSN